MIKNITLSAEEFLIQKARSLAAHQHKSLNELFREWLAKYAGKENRSAGYQKLMQSLKHVRAGSKFSREEMNER